MKDKRVPLFCSKCNKLLAKIEKNGSCKGIYLYCKSCKKEYEITYKETEPKSQEVIRK